MDSEGEDAVYIYPRIVAGGGPLRTYTKPLVCITVWLFLICWADLESQVGLLCDVFAVVSDTKGGLEIYYRLKIFFILKENWN